MIDGKSHLGGGHICGIVRGSFYAGQSEEAENPVKSRRNFLIHLLCLI